MALAYVQSNSGAGGGTGLTTSKTLGSTPTAGNLLIAWLFTGNNATDTTFTVDETKWFLIDRAMDMQKNKLAVTAIGRYVQSGDTTTMPAFCSAGSDWHAWAVQEISGVTGSWDTDFHSSSVNQRNDGVAAISAYQQTTRAANTMALVGFAKYNMTSAGTLSAGWTADVNTVNGANYGSYGCGHQAFASNGSTVDATYTAATAATETRGIITIILTTTQPTVPRVVRSRTLACTVAASVPGALPFCGTPKVGNLIVAFLRWSMNSTADAPAPTFGASWTSYHTITNGSTLTVAAAAYRYVQGGDTRTLPALCSGTSNFWAVTFVEIAGLTGTFSLDHVNTVSGYQASGSTFATTSDNTTGPNQIGLTAFAEYQAVTAGPTVSGATPLDLRFYNGEYGGIGFSEEYAASGGTAIASTWTPQSSAKKQAYIQSIFGGASAAAATRPFVFCCT